jgi:hypothetical protein
MKRQQHSQVDIDKEPAIRGADKESQPLKTTTDSGRFVMAHVKTPGPRMHADPDYLVMKNAEQIIHWHLPWRPLNHGLDLPARQRQFEREVAEGRQLWGRGTRRAGRRIDNDDVLVICLDGGVASVHLDWGTGTHTTPAAYPSIVEPASLTAFQDVMNNNAREYTGIQTETATPNHPCPHPSNDCSPAYC